MAAPPLTPTGVFTYPGDTQIQDIILLPGGTHALALFRIGSVNLWSVLVYHWIEIATAIAVGALLAALLHLVRRPRQKGKPHCRRCNYLLVGVTGSVCPECGLDLAGRNRVIGRSRRFRIAVVSVGLGTLVALYAYGHDRVPRAGTLNSWCEWLSPGLYDWAYHSNQRWLTRHKSWRCRVVELDLADGSVTRTLFSRDGIMPGEFALHPDGTSFILSEGDALTHLDLKGRRIASLKAEDVGVNRLDQVTIDAQGDTVYTAAVGRRIWVWQLGDGTHREVLVRSPVPLSRVTLVPYRDRAVLSGTERYWYEEGRVEGEGYGPGGDRERRVSTLHDLEGQDRVASLVLDVGPVRMSQEGRWIVCADSQGFGVWDAETGERRHSIPAAWARGDPEIFMVGADARFVVLPKYPPPELRLWDLDAGAWAGAYTGPVTLWFRARLSIDRTRMVALGLNVAGGQTQFKILTWDLPP